MRFVFALLVVFAGAAGWKQHSAPFVAHFPADHGNHPEFRTEWWYTTGELESGDQQRFGFQLTIFRQGLEPGLSEPGEPYWSARELYAGHLALTELGANKTRVAERARRANGALAGAIEGDLDVWIEDWRFVRDPKSGELHAVASAREQGFALDLTLVPAKAPVLHGPQGLSGKGPEAGNASAYVSWTRLATHGTLTLDTHALDVHGEAWFDHEWGTSQLGEGVTGWDWFGLRLDGGRELMLYRLRRADGTPARESSATLVRADGSTRTLSADEVVLTVEERWTSARTHASYPARWKLSIASEKLELVLAPRIPDCEIDGRASTGVVYWEGPVAVSGSAAGSGYAELVGYAGSLAGRF